MHLNLENGPVIPDEEWEQACRDITDVEHINGWYGLPDIRRHKKRRFKCPVENPDGDGWKYVKTKQTSYLRKTPYAILPELQTHCLTWNKLNCLRVPEPLPPEHVELARIPEESIELNPENENVHFQVQDVQVLRHEEEEEEVVASAPAALSPGPFDEARFQGSLAMGLDTCHLQSRLSQFQMQT